MLNISQSQVKHQGHYKNKILRMDRNLRNHLSEWAKVCVHEALPSVYGSMAVSHLNLSSADTTACKHSGPVGLDKPK